MPLIRELFPRTNASIGSIIKTLKNTACAKPAARGMTFKRGIFAIMIAARLFNKWRMYTAFLAFFRNFRVGSLISRLQKAVSDFCYCLNLCFVSAVLCLLPEISKFFI